VINFSTDGRKKFQFSPKKFLGLLEQSGIVLVSAAVEVDDAIAVDDDSGLDVVGCGPIGLNVRMRRKLRDNLKFETLVSTLVAFEYWRIIFLCMAKLL